MIIYCLNKIASWSILFFFTILFLTFTRNVLATHSNSAHCGNGVCQPSQNEDSLTCPADCGGAPTPTPTPAPTSTPAPTNNPTPTPSSGSSPSPTSTPGSSNDSNSSSSSTPSITYYPSVTLNTYSPNPTNKVPLTFSGKASIEQGTITLVEYTITNGADWISVQLSNGNFTFTTPQFVDGKYIIKVRAKSQANVYTQEGSYASQTIIIATNPPKVILDKISPNPSKNQSPTISGKTTSSLAGISKVEVTIDGKSWQTAQRLGSTFNFTVKNKLEDGNYNITARAFDNAGNIGQSDTLTLVVDTIPPIIGGGMQALGPQLLIPDSNGVVRIVAGTKTTYALSMKGGVTEAKIKTQDESFDLKLQPDSNLWFGTIEFKKVGEKQIKISAIDGAANKTERNLNTVLVEDFGKVFDKQTQKGIEEAKVSVYFFETQSNQWILWEGDSYGQSNPQKTTLDGNYSFMVPPGKYYIDVYAPGYHPIQSEILNLSQTSILNYKFPLTSKPNVVLNLPFFGKVVLAIPSFKPQTLSTSILTQSNQKLTDTNLTLSQGVIAPNLILPNLNNQEINLSTFKGKKVLLSFISPWSSLSLEQAAILSETSSVLTEGQSILVVSLQESIASTENFMKRGNYKFLSLVDRNGQTAASYKITLLPQHFFIDKRGKIQEVYVGTLSKSEILEKLKNLP